MSNRSRPLRVGVVGCGGFGRNAYVNNAVENPDASLVALCDVDLAQAEAAAREVFDDRGIKPRPALYTDYKAMIDQKSLDVVMVGTMAGVRPRVAIYALNAGAHVLAAKPMAPSLAEAEEMLQKAKEADRILMVGYNSDSAMMHKLCTALSVMVASGHPALPVLGRLLLAYRSADHTIKQRRVEARSPELGFTRWTWQSGSLAIHLSSPCMDGRSHVLPTFPHCPPNWNPSETTTTIQIWSAAMSTSPMASRCPSRVCGWHRRRSAITVSRCGERKATFR